MERTIRIGVDARPLIYAHNGNARYLYRMLGELIRQHRNFEIVLFSHKPLHMDHQDLLTHSNVLLNIDTGPLSKVGLAWINFRLPTLLRDYSCDVFWGTLAMLPLTSVPDIPMVVNFHDLNSYAAPETMTRGNRIQHRILDSRVIEKAKAVYCLSKTTMDDILKYVPATNPDRLHLVYPGVDRNPVDPEPLPSDFSKLENFILAIGTVEPRKNYETLVAGYLLARQNNESIPPLLIIGRKGWGDDTLYNKLSSGYYSDSGIFYFEGASDRHIVEAFNKCLYLAFSSLHEGFGLPIIEAFQLGKPVVLSDIPVFREIAEGSHFCSPLRQDDWAGAFQKYSKDNLPPLPDFKPEEWTWENRASLLGRLLEESILE